MLSLGKLVCLIYNLFAVLDEGFSFTWRRAPCSHCPEGHDIDLVSLTATHTSLVYMHYAPLVVFPTWAEGNLVRPGDDTMLSHYQLELPPGI